MKQSFGQGCVIKACLRCGDPIAFSKQQFINAKRLVGSMFPRKTPGLLQRCEKCNQEAYLYKTTRGEIRVFWTRPEQGDQGLVNDTLE